MSGTMSWSVVQTESQRELVAADYLRRDGFEVYFPRIHIRSHGRVRDVALFRSYMFVRVGSHWYRARWCIGVVRVLMMDIEQPAQVPDQYIDALRKQQGSDGFIRLPQMTQMRKGQRVKLLRGPLEGFSGLYEGQSGPERVTVLIDLLGRLSRAQLPIKDVAIG